MNNRTRGRLRFVVGGALLASACSLADDGPMHLRARGVVANDDRLPDRPSAGNEGDEYLFEVAREVPSYGGHRQLPDGSFLVSVTNPADFAPARRAIRARIANRRIFTKLGEGTPTISAVLAEYSIKQLAVWRDTIFAERKSLGWTLLDLGLSQI